MQVVLYNGCKTVQVVEVPVKYLLLDNDSYFTYSSTEYWFSLTGRLPHLSEK